MADEKFSKKTFGKTYYPITQNEMSNNRFKNFTGDKKFGSREDLNKYHSNLKEKLNKQKVRPSEISKLDKEFKARMKRANDDVQYRLANRPGMAKERKKQKNTIPDTGSAFAKGGRVGLKKGTPKPKKTFRQEEQKGMALDRVMSRPYNPKDTFKDYVNRTRAMGGNVRTAAEMEKSISAAKSAKKSDKRVRKADGGRTNYRGGGLATSGYGKVMKS